MVKRKKNRITLRDAQESQFDCFIGKFFVPNHELNYEYENHSRYSWYKSHDLCFYGENRKTSREDL